ncbi:Cof-type HAD-IIB family hydrolase [Niallia sp. Krafla_26]|uniref:Cof-type HAD-IIB family hydrolase n=1 Tax=Niallia sp. Krafla_26 TaxID=3064703 RepID=UPI003D1625CF
MIKLIAIDLDGTLLNDEITISQRNIDAIKRANEKGVEIVVATGRADFDAASFFKELDINPWIIATNGATIHSPEGKLFQSCPLDKQQAMNMLIQLEEDQFYYEAFIENKICAPEYGKKILIDEIEAGVRTDEENALIRRGIDIQFSQSAFTFISSYKELMNRDMDIYNILVISYLEDKLKKGWEKYTALPHLTVVQSGRYNFHLQNEQASKGNALKLLTQKLGVKLSETAAIGDNHNDLSMLEIVGKSAAMGNADEVVKEVCDVITLNHNEDGVALFIESILEECSGPL